MGAVGGSSGMAGEDKFLHHPSLKRNSGEAEEAIGSLSAEPEIDFHVSKLTRRGR